MRTLLLVAAFLSAAGLSTTSCKKEGPAEAVVIVTDSLGARITSATVVLRQDSVTNPVNGVQASVNQTQLTDEFGQAYFSFELESVLIVEAEKGTLSARDFIRLEQSKKVTKSLIIR
ncbi:MAG: hypothetical protein ACK5C5_02270 [Bacteroidota bacterium]|jgi:hypothetical protein